MFARVLKAPQLLLRVVKGRVRRVGGAVMNGGREVGMKYTERGKARWD